MTGARIAVGVVVALLVAAFFALDLGGYLSLEQLAARHGEVEAWRAAHPVLAPLVYFAVYVAVTALSLPGAAIMTLAGGAVFGLVQGTVLVSFASTVGATAAFLIARFVLRDAVQARFGESLRAVNAGVEREGAFYLFTLRLVPAFPFFVINIAMALTPMRTLAFALVSQAGMLPGTVVYVNAGTRLASIDALSEILSPAIVGSFVLLGVFPLLAKRVVEAMRSRKVYEGWSRPRRFDRDMVVIGAGAAGLVSAYVAAAVRAKVTLVEGHRMGGDCLNTGCVPSKALIRSAKLVHQIRHADRWGVRRASADFDFAELMDRVRDVIATIEPHDSVERYTALGVECIAGHARIVSPWSVEVDGRTLTTRSIVVAAGAEPLVPPIPGIEEVGYLTSETLWDLRELPARLVVLGGGPIGTELAQCFARLGSRVTQVEMRPRILAREDPEIAEMVAMRLREEGVEVLTGHRAERFEVRDGAKVLIAGHGDGEVEIGFDALLCAVGRVPRTSGYGLETLGIETTAARTIEVDEYLRTRFPNVYACGDVAGPYQFTHTAAHQAWFAAVNALFGTFRRFRADYSVVPWATFTDPEVARVGLNETEARERGIACEVTTYRVAELDRAIADGEAHGVVKVLTVPGKDRILGATIVAERAGELIAEYVAAMRHRFGMNAILGTIHVYPTLAEANKYAAGEWKKAHAPERVLRLLERYHAWRRG